MPILLTFKYIIENTPCPDNSGPLLKEYAKFAIKVHSKNVYLLT